MPVFIGLVRAINVGGTGIVKMSDFKRFLEAVGLSSVKTLLQSGNFVFESTLESPEEIESLLENEAAIQLGFQRDFYVRSLREWRQTIDANPFPGEAKSQPNSLLVFVSKTSFDEKVVATIRSLNSGPEQIVAIDRVLYVLFPDGQGASKLSTLGAWKKLIRRSTGRNWNTVMKLHDLSQPI